MAKKSSIENNLRRIHMAARDADKRKVLKDLIKDRDLPMDERFQAVMKLSKLPRNGSKIRVRNRCALTGRARGYYRKLQLSRIALRDLATSGMIPGVVKASW